MAFISRVQASQARRFSVVALRARANAAGVDVTSHSSGGTCQGQRYSAQHGSSIDANNLMLKLKVTTRDGQLHDLTCPDNVTVMEAIRDSGIYELAAICGGACSCATCHVHFDAASFQRLEPMLDDEDGLLDGSSHRTPYSRLSCQVRLKPSLDELELQIASED